MKARRFSSNLLLTFDTIFTACKLQIFLLVFKSCYFFMFFHYNSEVKKGVGRIYSQSKGRGFHKISLRAENSLIFPLLQYPPQFQAIIAATPPTLSEKCLFTPPRWHPFATALTRALVSIES